VPASSRRQFRKASYFFFLETFLVFFAVFFTALFAFFAFFAFLAMLPSGVSERPTSRCAHLIAACTRESKCTTSRIHQHIEKNSVSLKEVLTSKCRSTQRAICNDDAMRCETTRVVREKSASANVKVEGNACAAGTSLIHNRHDKSCTT
jgi:hypothetical protein